MKLTIAFLIIAVGQLASAHIEKFEHYDIIEKYDYRKNVNKATEVCGNSKPTGYASLNNVDACIDVVKNAVLIHEKSHDLCGSYASSSAYDRTNCYKHLVNVVLKDSDFDSHTASSQAEQIARKGVNISKYIDAKVAPYIQVAMEVEAEKSAVKFCHTLDQKRPYCKALVYERNLDSVLRLKNGQELQVKPINYTALSFCTLIPEENLRFECGHEVMTRFIPTQNSDIILTSFDFRSDALVKEVKSAGRTWEEMKDFDAILVDGIVEKRSDFVKFTNRGQCVFDEETAQISSYQLEDLLEQVSLLTQPDGTEFHPEDVVEEALIAEITIKALLDKMDLCQQDREVSAEEYAAIDEAAEDEIDQLYESTRIEDVADAKQAAADEDQADSDCDYRHDGGNRFGQQRCRREYVEPDAMEQFSRFLNQLMD